MRSFYKKQLEKQPNVMTVGQVAAFTGYCKNSVGKWCSKKGLQCFFIRKRFQIPKEYLLDFRVSKYFIGIAVKSEKHQKFNKQIRKLR